MTLRAGVPVVIVARRSLVVPPQFSAGSLRSRSQGDGDQPDGPVAPVSALVSLELITSRTPTFALPAVTGAPGLTMRRGAHADSGYRRGGDVGRQDRAAAGARWLSGVRAHLAADAR